MSENAEVPHIEESVESQPIVDNLQISRKPQQIIEAFERHDIIGYEPNVLDEEQKLDLISRIKSRITETEDASKKEDLEALVEFIEQHGYIFPEFAHGTSSDALESIVTNGLLPKHEAAQYHDQEHVQDLGEGNRGGRNLFSESVSDEDEEDVIPSSFISAGIGQRGLGTAIAYAEMVQDPTWNPNVRSEEDLVKAIEDTNSRLAQRDNAALRNRLSRYTRALLRYQQGIKPDFPIVIGFSQTNEHHGVETLEAWQVQGTSVLKGGRLVKALEREMHELEGETIFSNTDKVPPRAIEVIGCPKLNINDLKARLSTQGHVAVISLEAIKALGDFGYENLVRSERASLKRIKNNLSFEELQAIFG